MKKIEIYINGTPKAQPRIRAVNRGRHAGVYTPTTARAWKQLIQLKLAPYKDTFKKGEPLHLSAHFYFLRPKSHLKKNNLLTKNAPIHHTQKPDKDNLEKAVKDAITDAGVWHDDSQVVSGLQSKNWTIYPEIEGVEIKIESF